MPNPLKLIDYYILSNAPQKIRQWALNTRTTHKGILGFNFLVYTTKVLKNCTIIIN